MRAKAERRTGPRSAATGLAEAPVPFPVASTEQTVDASIEALQIALNDTRGLLEGDPYVNPIALLALDLLQRLTSGALDEPAVEALIQRLTREAFAARAAAARRYLGELDPAGNRESIRQLLLQQARDKDGRPAPFAVFAKRLERVHYGFVFTAHPTFGRSMELQTMLASAAFGAPAQEDVEGKRQLRELLARAEKLVHRPPPRLDLKEEHVQSVMVIAQARAIVRQVYEVAFDVARELYPADWRRLRPSLLTLATWVGYDTDGRADIGWTTTFAKRLILQLNQLRHYRAMVQACVDRARGETLVVSLLELLEARLALAVKSAEDDLVVLDDPGAQDSEWRKRLARTARDMVKGRSARLTHAAQVLDLVDRALAAVEDDATARELCILRAELVTQGLVGAGTHVRINAIQLHNAIRKTIGMDHAPDDPTHRLTYVNAVAKLIDGTEPETINFASVTDERATARRMFMTVTQMLKHLDGSEPIRFLIAECETSFTLLTALYFAKVFGVDDRIDISPLFETRTALERGAEIIAGALAVPAYRDYLRGRGRICIQTGFSDAGRYMGQPAACALIEKIRLGMTKVLAEYALTDLELTIFDTHGESIGRGAHPGSFVDRLRYYDTPESRRQFAAAGIALRQETSFQGGDGYLYFLAPESALSVTTRILEHCLDPPAEPDDPFYVQQDYVDEFFAAVEQFNEQVIEHPCYATFLGAYGTSMLYPTGSRALRRQYDGAGARAALEHPSQLRAIPHNSILQQLGTLANTIGGVGEAVAKDPERFHDLYRTSSRFRRLVTMVEHAFKFTDLDVVKAYVDLFDPEPWLRRAAAAAEQTEQEELRTVADYLERIDLHDRLARIHRVFHRDYMDLARALREHRRMARDAGEQPIAVDAGTRDNLHMLHALRLALIQRLMLLAVRVPDFSDRHATTHDTLIVRLMHLEVEPALELLGQIFPVTEEDEEVLDFGETATYRNAGGQSYLTEHQTIFRPIARDFELIRRISSGVIYHVGAVG
jgi:phosphoenolpyruvate carboxylase